MVYWRDDSGWGLNLCPCHIPFWYKHVIVILNDVIVGYLVTFGTYLGGLQGVPGYVEWLITWLPIQATCRLSLATLSIW